MDTVINRLSDIEKAAVSVMDGASERKKQMAREMEEKTAAFDAQLEKENQDRISQIRSKMEEELQQELRQQSEDAKATMKRLEATYENRHEEYAQALFKNMIRSENMGSLISYSGISTKVKAMERFRIRPEQFEAMADLGSVPEAVQFLRSNPSYEKAFSKASEDELHRGKIEQLLNLSKYHDFAKLYRFANVGQRRFLDLYFMHYEIDILKTCLRNAAGNRESAQDLSGFKEFFDKHSDMDLVQLSQCRSIEDVIRGLKGSAYYEPLEKLLEQGKATLPACETAMDMLYFKTIWKIKDKYLSKAEAKMLAQCFGTKMDMLNFQWICRAKKYYNLSEGDIYALIIPIQYHVTKKEIQTMAQAENMEQVYGVIKNSWYKCQNIEELMDQGLGNAAKELTDKIYELTSRKEPYSAAVLNSYLYFKEREIEQIITTIEKIRYGMTART